MLGMSAQSGRAGTAARVGGSRVEPTPPREPSSTTGTSRETTSASLLSTRDWAFAVASLAIRHKCLRRAVDTCLCFRAGLQRRGGFAAPFVRLQQGERGADDCRSCCKTPARPALSEPRPDGSRGYHEARWPRHAGHATTGQGGASPTWSQVRLRAWWRASWAPDQRRSKRRRRDSAPSGGSETALLREALSARVL